MKHNYYYIISIIIILSISLYLAPPFITSLIKKNEGFINNSNDLKTPGDFPVSVDKAILDYYPLIGKNETSNNNYNNIWWQYPVFPVGSYKQITNNLQYRYNPDQGNCVRADFCGALYNNNKTKTNIILPLSPAEEGLGARVGYFRTDPNMLYYSIPTNENILY